MVKKSFKLLMGIVMISLILVGCSNDNLEKVNDDLNDTYIEYKYNSDETFNKDLNIKSGDEEIKKLKSGDENETASNISVKVIPASTANLSNKVCAWGFRRMKDGVQPEFTASYTKPLDDYEGIYVGNSGEQKIYLTFDEGYENGYTSSILDTLKEKEVTAVFFVTMPYVKQNPDLIKRMIDEGHIVGNHTVNHPSMPSVTDDEKLKKEILELHDYVTENFDYEMEFLRPPKGEYSERTVAIAKSLGYRTVLWSSAYADWDVNNQKGNEYAKSMILNYLHNGCVMLLHAVSKDNDAVLGEVIDEIRNRGFEICSLEDFEY